MPEHYKFKKTLRETRRYDVTDFQYFFRKVALVLKILLRAKFIINSVLLHKINQFRLKEVAVVMC
jgi:hypothetical protein